jgi:L-asparaginase II
MSARPLFSFSRKGIPEVVVHGIVAMKRQGQVLSGIDASSVLVTRSLLKPWQALASGGFDADHSYWAMGFASHSGEGVHLECLHKLIEATGASEQELVCPRVHPLDATVAASMRANGQSASRLHHPCAGKHLLMLAAAKKEGLSTEDYWHEDHPIQKRVHALVGREASEKLTWVTDSCGLPVASMSVRALMNMYERLALDQTAPVVNLKSLWLENSRLIGGSRRLDTDLMKASEKRVVAKEGADGLLVVQSLPSESESVSGCFVKIASGYNVSHLGIGLWCLLSSQNELSAPMVVLRDYLRSRLEEWVPKDQTLNVIYRAE